MPESFLHAYRRLSPFVKKYVPRYLIGIAFLLMTNTGQLFLPQAIRFGLDNLDRREFALMAIGALAIFVALGRIGWRLFIVSAARNAEKDLRQAVFHHLTTLEPAYYHRMPVGDLMSRLTNDLQNVRMSLGMSVITFVDGTFMGLSIVGILLATDLLLGSLSILPFLLLIGVFLVFGRLIGQLFSESMQSMSRISDESQEALTAIRVIQSFHREEHFFQRLHEAGKKYLHVSLRLVQIWGFFFPLVTFVTGLTVWVSIAVGGSLLMEGRLSVGTFAAFLSYLGMLAWPMVSVAFTINMLQRGASSLRRLYEILDTEPGIVSLPNATSAAPTPLEVRNLSFRYRTDSTPALEDVSFNFPEQGALGVLGTIGSGKSTLAWLLCRLLDPPPGTVFLGGKDIVEWPLPELRKLFSMVPQAPFLFSDTIYNNILMGRPDASRLEVERVVETAGLGRDLAMFPEGLQTMVGERGITLSGGQKQRVALARALVAERHYLILDDALSAVDAETEKLILDYLFRRSATRHIMIVSHRIGTLMHCTKVIVLDGGRLVQAGDPRELLRTEGVFAEIARIQRFEREAADV